MDGIIILGIALWTGIMGFMFGQMYQMRKDYIEERNNISC